MRVVVLLIALLAPTAGAFMESEAPGQWQAQFGDGSAAVSHAPEQVFEGDQFEGTLTLSGVSNVTEMRYQVCIVADACIIAPRPAERVAQNTWHYDTADFQNPINGKPHKWLAEQWIGIQWFVSFEGNDTMHPFPEPWTDSDPRCADHLACEASHYFTFYVEPKDASTPGVGPGILMLALLLGAVAGGSRGRRP